MLDGGHASADEHVPKSPLGERFEPDFSPLFVRKCTTFERFQNWSIASILADAQAEGEKASLAPRAGIALHESWIRLKSWLPSGKLGCMSGGAPSQCVTC